jgi:NAD(P)-dependent dehydrogenase (short-subunit alcohol dehydrogenase family)
VKVAVVTGASRGIGAAVKHELEARGYEVHDLSRSSGVDLRDEAALETAFAGLERLDALVNNAAALVMKPLLELSSSDWDEVVGVGLRGAFLCSRAAFRLMEPGGAIVNVSSLSGVAGAEKFAGMAAYVAAKSGLAGLTEALAVEGRPRGIRVNAVSPASVDTEMGRAAGIAQDPLRPEDVARVVAWLATPESAPLTGANLRIDPPAQSG